MEGFDHDWTAAGQRRVAYYTNLPPGRYRFHVVAYELDAPHNASEQVLALELEPHFYRRVVVPGTLRGRAHGDGLGLVPHAPAEHPPALRRRLE